MNKRGTKGRVKNPCRICNHTVAHKSGVQCKGACARWAHFKCLGYSPQKILDIRDGVIKITCPCPSCKPKVPVEELVKTRPIKDFFEDKLPLGDVPCPPEASCQSPKKTPCQSPSRQPSPIDDKKLPPCRGPPDKDMSPTKKTSCKATGINLKTRSPCQTDRTHQPAPNTISPRQLPPRKQYLYQPIVRKQSACQPLHGKPPCQEPGDLEPPCQPIEKVSKFQRISPKRSLLKPKDDFAFNPTSFEPQLFQPAAFKPGPPPSNPDTCDPHCIGLKSVPPPCDTPKCRIPSPKCTSPVPSCPSSPVPSCPPSPKNETFINNDCKTPPLSRTPSKISLVSPKVSPKLSNEICPSTLGEIPKVPVPVTKHNQHNNAISPCKKSAPCQAPPPDTSLSCCKTCKNCKCSSDLSLMKSNCNLSNCPSNVLAKKPPKAPPPSLKSTIPCKPKTNNICMDCTSSICPQKGVPAPPKSRGIGLERCVNCTSSICPNQNPCLRSVETCTEKKTKSCGCLTVSRESNIRSMSDSTMTNTGKSMLFSAINQLCTTVGLLSGQIRTLMSKIQSSGKNELEK